VSGESDRFPHLEDIFPPQVRVSAFSSTVRGDVGCLLKVAFFVAVLSVVSGLLSVVEKRGFAKQRTTNNWQLTK
jgi:hypothetical protein